MQRRLKAELAQHGRNCRIWLDDIEITEVVSKFEITADVGGMTIATITFPAIEVSAEGDVEAIFKPNIVQEFCEKQEDS